MTQNTKVISPTGSYSLRLPEGIAEQYEDRVVSFWRTGEGILLQISSYHRVEGPQTPAGIRLDELLAREQLSVITRNVAAHVDCPDWAAVLATDDEGIQWFYGYGASVTGLRSLECQRIKVTMHVITGFGKGRPHRRRA